MAGVDVHHDTVMHMVQRQSTEASTNECEVAVSAEVSLAMKLDEEGSLARARTGSHNPLHRHIMQNEEITK